MRVRAKFGAMMIAGVLAASGVARGQEMQMPGQEQHHPMQMAVIKPEYPRMGRAQEKVKGALVTLGQVQKIASDSNPTLRRRFARPRHASNKPGCIRTRQWFTREMKSEEDRSAAGSRDFLCSRRSLRVENSG